MNEFTLPNGVIINGVLYNKAHLDELTGKQQNYLVNTKYKSPVDHIEKILVDLLIDIRDDSSTSILNHVDKQHLILHSMPIQDIQFLLIKLREISFGERYFFDKLECPHCRAKNHAQIRLDLLNIINDKIESSDPLILPVSGLKIEYKHLSLAELKLYGADSEKLLNNHVTESCLSLLSTLGGEKPSRERIEALKAKDINFIVDKAPKYNYLDNKITHTCSACKSDFDFEMGEMSADFFVHSRI